jgi:DNA (cytosine-5)-methyltransferase 1
MPLVPTSGEALGGSGFFQSDDFIIRSENFGVPQARHRLIILGIRSDIRAQPDLLDPQEKISVRDAIGDLPRVRSGLSKSKDSEEAWRRAIGEIKDADWLNSDSLSREMRSAIREAISAIPPDLERGDRFLEGSFKPGFNERWFADRKLRGVCNHETRGHIAGDLHRYLFASVFAKLNGRSPNLEDFPAKLLPAHKNVGEALKGSKFNDRFRVQVADRPSTTVVSHISKDGHYYIHYDPTQCRSLTVREAARLQTFPDNYFFEGNRTQQYQQVGNAVPPLLARQIAEIVARILK